MDFGVVQPSDLLRTGGAVFLLTRKSKLLKFLGWLMLGGEIYTMVQKERGLDPMTGKPIAVLPSASSGALKGMLGYSGR